MDKMKELREHVETYARTTDRLAADPDNARSTRDILIGAAGAFRDVLSLIDQIEKG